MIYISNSLYLSGSFPSDDFNENNPIVGYKSVLTPDDITAPASISTSPPGNAWTPDTAQAWVGEGAAAIITQTLTQTLDLHNSNNEIVDYIGIAKHNFGSAQLTHRVQHSNDGVTWTDLSADAIVSNDDSIIHYFDQLTSSYFRIRITKTSTDIPSPIVGHVKLGSVLVLQRRIYVGHMPAPLSKKVKRTQYGSENGQYLGQIIQRSYRTTTINQENNAPDFVRTNIVPFIDHINGHVEIEDTAPATFFFSWRPGDYPKEVIYGWSRDNVDLENQGGDQLGGRMSWSLNVEAVA